VRSWRAGLPVSERDRHARNVGGALGLEDPDPDVGFDLDLDLGFTPADCVAPLPGQAIGGPGDSPLSLELQLLTAAQFQAADAQPWIEGLLPGNRIPRTTTTTAATTTTAPAPSS
jgi:hypothetical protein